MAISVTCLVDLLEDAFHDLDGISSGFQSKVRGGNTGHRLPKEKWVQSGVGVGHDESAAHQSDTACDAWAAGGTCVPAVGSAPLQETWNVQKGLRHRVEEAVLLARRIDKAVLESLAGARWCIVQPRGPRAFRPRPVLLPPQRYVRGRAEVPFLGVSVSAEP